jgi:hypothetical protein
MAFVALQSTGASVPDNLIVTAMRAVFVLSWPLKNAYAGGRVVGFRPFRDQRLTLRVGQLIKLTFEVLPVL